MTLEDLRGGKKYWCGRFNKKDDSENGALTIQATVVPGSSTSKGTTLTPKPKPGLKRPYVDDDPKTPDVGDDADEKRRKSKKKVKGPNNLK